MEGVSPALQPLPSHAKVVASVPLRSRATFLSSHWFIFPSLCDWLFFPPQIRSAAKTTFCVSHTNPRLSSLLSCKARGPQGQRSGHWGAVRWRVPEGAGDDHMLRGPSEDPCDQQQRNTATRLFCNSSNRKHLLHCYCVPIPTWLFFNYSNRKHLLQCYCLPIPTRLLEHSVTHPTLRGG